MAKSTAPNYKWTCNIPGCGQTNQGFPDVDAAAADANDHYESTHAGSENAPNFTYEDLNVAPEEKSPRTRDDIWADIPSATPLTKEDLAEFFGMGV